jgi:SGNH domain-containing protein/acyltransferase-like protein
LLPTRAWELLLGTALALGGLRAPSATLAASAGGFGLALIALTVVLYSPYMDFPGLAAVPPCVGAVLVLYAGQRATSPIARALSFGPVRFVGKISYSLYLWHLPPLVLARIYLDRELTVAESVVLIAAATAAAVISWRFVETPFRRVGKADVRWRVIGLGVTASAAFSLLGVALIASRGVAARFAPDVVVADAAQLERDYPATCVGPYATGGSCVDKPIDVLVWGDSHAAHYFEGVQRRAAAAGLTAQLQWSDGCPAVLDAVPVTVPIGNATLGAPARRNVACASINDGVLALIRANPSITAVALAGAWDFWGTSVDIGTNERRYLSARDSTEIGLEESQRVLRAGLERTVGELRQLGVQVLLLGQVPDYVRSPSDCMARARAAGMGTASCPRSRDEALARSAWTRETLREIATAHGAAVFDAAGRLCAGSACLIEADGAPFYRDSDHLSPEGSAFLGNALPAEFFHEARRVDIGSH